MLLIEFVSYICLGAIVGGLVGAVGVGGGALMTPALLFTGIPIHIAVGTDLLYAAMTKLSGTVAHWRRGHIAWRPLSLLAFGSIPATMITLVLISHTPVGTFAAIVPPLLGFALIATGLTVILVPKARTSDHQAYPAIYTVLAGTMLGFLVTITSVGAGAIGAAILLLLTPRLTGARVVGTDVAHAAPLALIGGLGYAYHGYTDWWVLLALLTGSIPAAHLGARLTELVPNQQMRRIIAWLLLVVGATTAATAAGLR